MALSAKLWPFTSALSNDKTASTTEKSTSSFLPKTTAMNSTLFGPSPVDDEILEQLNTADFELRLRTLNRLRNLALGHDLWFKRFNKKLELFKALASVLSDSNWEVQYQCIKFLTDTMRDYGSDLEWCMAVIWPCLVPKLASPKITVRRVCVQCLLAYVKRVDGVHTLEKALLQYGLSKSDKNFTKEMLKEMPNLFIGEFRVFNWSILTEGLIEFLCVSVSDRESSDLVLMVLERLLQLVGQYQFNNYVHNLAPQKKARYEELLLQRGSSSVTYAHNGRGLTLARFDPAAVADSDDTEEYSEMTAIGTSVNGKQFRYGIVPVSLVDQLNNETDWQTRYDGLEKLKTFIENMTEGDMKKLQPHLFSYINLLSNILDDLNIKNIVLALDALRASVVKMRRHLEPHLQHVVGAMAKHLGNQKAVVKQLNLSIVLELMRQLHPKQVFAVLCGYLQHRNSRVREEVLNVITIALLTHPSSDFNISAVAHIISPLLADGKRRVRLAAFECTAVLANCVTAGKMETIMKHVREVEDSRSAPGLVQAVQSRLARNLLPKIRNDGLLEYAAWPVSPSNEEPRKFSTESGRGSAADIEWIMSAGVGQGSAVSRSLSPIRFRAITAMEKQKSGSISTTQEQRQQTPAPVRRVLSAGRNLRKLPWENGYEQQQQQQILAVQQQVDRVNNRSVPIKPNETPSAPDGQQRPAPRPAKLVDHLSSMDDPHKPNIPSVTKYGQSLANGKAVLLPLETNARSSTGGVDRMKSKSSPPPIEKEVSSSWDKAMWNENKRSVKDGPVKNTQGVTSLVNVTARDYKNSWDEVPIKPASREQLTAYYGECGVIRGDSVPASMHLQKHSLVDPMKAVSDGRRSSDTTDTQPPSTAGTAPRKAPVLAKRSSFKKPTGSTGPPGRKVRSDSVGTPQSTLDRPYTNPQQALSTALKKLASEEWTDKVEGISAIERLAQYNTNTLASEIQPVVIALNNEAKNLRSSVSKQALGCYCNLFQHLKRSMDPEVERVCAVLMAKTGDTSNAFMREGATRALESMVDHVSPQKALNCVVSAGARHKSATVRSACSQLVRRLVENMGPSKVLVSQPDFLEKVLLTACQFANDTQPQPRCHGKAILALLSEDADFHRAASKCLTDSQQRTMFNMVNNLKLKGVSSGSNLSVSLNGSASSAHRGALSRNSSIRRKTKLPDEAADTFLAAEKDLVSSSWEERLKGVNRLSQLSQTYANTLSEDVKLMEMYMARLNDINGKVAAQALQCLPDMLANLGPHMNDVLRPVSTEMVKCLSSQLPSKNEDIRRMAQNGLDCALKHLDNSALIQPLSIAAKTGNIKQKPDLLKRLGKVSQNIFPTKSKLVQMHALPVLFNLVKMQQADQALRQATMEYARTLARLVGTRALLDSATSLSPDQKSELEDMLR